MNTTAIIILSAMVTGAIIYFQKHPIVPDIIIPPIPEPPGPISPPVELKPVTIGTVSGEIVYQSDNAFYPHIIFNVSNPNDYEIPLALYLATYTIIPGKNATITAWTIPLTKPTLAPRETMSFNFIRQSRILAPTDTTTVIWITDAYHTLNQSNKFQLPLQQDPDAEWSE